MDATTKCACGHVIMDFLNDDNGDSECGEGNRICVEDDEMSTDMENNNTSKSGDGNRSVEDNEMSTNIENNNTSKSGGDGDGTCVADNEMSTDIENNNTSKSGGDKHDSRNDNTQEQELRWLELDKALDELTEKEVFSLKFDSDEDAAVFYEAYAKVVGFTVRKFHTRRDKNNVVKYRNWVCSREGCRDKKWVNYLNRKRDPRPVSRIGCRASFRVKRDKKSGKYVVTRFVKEHNHELLAPKVVTFLQPQKRARRVIEDVGLAKKDIERAWASSDIRVGDTEYVLTHCVSSYLCAKSDYDPGLFHKHDVDEEDKMCSVFWADSKSRADYAFFGDVLALNTKFRKNAYEKPFIIVTGVNNHDQTIVFGCALLRDETTETYVWLLETFLEAMNHKPPVSVITDGDKAIDEAIVKTFPTSQHRICRWHLCKAAVSNAGDTSFGSDFSKCMEENCTPEEFEEAWIKLLEKYGLHGHPWFEETYSRRTKWAEAYLREHFFAGLNSIRGHGMNTYFTRFLQIQLKLREFVRYYDKALVCLREDEAKADMESESTFPAFCTVLRDLERHAADVFTKTIFLKVREQIMGDAMLILSIKEYLKDEACWIYTFSEYMKPDKIWKVKYHPTNQSFTCPCFKLVTEGVPCCHMISVMKAEHLREFPRCCINKRWTKSARSELDSSIDIQALNMATQVARFRVLSSSCSEMNYYASQTIQGFNETRSLISKLTSHVKQIYVSKGGVDEPAPEGILDAHGSSTRSGLHDPKSTNCNGQCNAGRVETPQPNDCSFLRCNSHDKTTFQQLHLNLGSQAPEGTGTTDDAEGSVHNGNFSEMPSLAMNLMQEDSD
ncbi:hypothetical protein ACH5RR_039700 [Cinchona calisaya]|uniref:Protein FAR1-RELATED SEQUENCE n=1 Tax=Cinchona calisaya TaxID=153742 RepID=A0ABD2XZ05_9GENT